tara:strand:- start:43 stop:585 length:543 start_codon:yes stop_codon:yes gene_type:complete
MATVNLTPDATVSSDWAAYEPGAGSGTAHENLADSDDDTGIRTQDQNDECIVTLTNYSAGGTINSIRHYIRGYLFNTRGGDTEVQVILENSGGTALYTENHQLLFNGYTPQDFNGTARTTSDGSSAWVDGDLDGLRLNINTIPEDPPGVSKATVVRAFVEVTFTSATAVTDNAVFFGSNF